MVLSFNYVKQMTKPVFTHTKLGRFPFPCSEFLHQTSTLQQYNLKQ